MMRREGDGQVGGGAKKGGRNEGGVDDIDAATENVCGGGMEISPPLQRAQQGPISSFLLQVHVEPTDTWTTWKRGRVAPWHSCPRGILLTWTRRHV